MKLATAVFRKFYDDSLITIEQLKSGGPNRNWLILCDKGSFVLKACVRNSDQLWLTFLEKLIEELVEQEYPIQPIVLSKSRQRTVQYEGHYWQLRPYVDGRPFDLGSKSDMQEAVDALVHLHQSDIRVSRISNPNPGIEQWLQSPEKNMEALQKSLERAILFVDHAHDIPLYNKTLNDALSNVAISIFHTLPTVPTHGDFHGTNLVYNSSGLAAVLDLDTVEFRPKIYDIAVAAFFLSRYTRGSFRIDPEVFKAFIRNYSKYDEVSRDEIYLISPLLRLHFLPTAYYLDILIDDAPFLLEWYFNWTRDALESIDQVDSIVESVATQ